jgi:hypothetical protein
VPFVRHTGGRCHAGFADEKLPAARRCRGDGGHHSARSRVDRYAHASAARGADGRGETGGRAASSRGRAHDALAPPAAPQQRPRGERRSQALYYRLRWSRANGEWTERQLALLGTDDEAVAERLGRSVAAVRVKRVRLRIPEFRDRRRE